jgi:hypothetical protein
MSCPKEDASEDDNEYAGDVFSWASELIWEHDQCSTIEHDVLGYEAKKVTFKLKVVSKVSRVFLIPNLL